MLRVKARGQRDLITVIGHAATIGAGEFVQASGRWVNDRTHGVQFRADFLRSAPPTTAEGIEKYLASGMIKGIGPIYAKKLVQAFSEAVFDVIEQKPERLQEVDGIGPKRAESIVAAWADQKAIREIMIFLHATASAPSRAVRIFKTYGADAIRADLREPVSARARHPRHRLQERRSDRREARHREDGDDPRPRRHRLRADRGDGRGPLRAAAEQLVPMAAKLLEVPAAIIETALDLELQDGEVIADTVDGSPASSSPACIGPSAPSPRASRTLRDRRPALAGDRCRQGHPVGREQGGHHPRREPARGGAAGPAIEGSRHHRRPRRRQDDAGQLDPEDPDGQGRATSRWPHRPAGRRSGCRRAPAARRRRSTGCWRSIPCTAASGATRITRWTATCSSSTRPR